jgi:hypothetical protein
MATYSFTDLAPANPKYIEMQVNSDGTTRIKKDYLKVSVVDDYVILRWHELEAGKNTHTLKILYSDVSSPSEGSATDLKDALEDFIKTGITGDTGPTGPDGDDGREVELQNNGTHIQWRYVGDVSWTDLVALSAITGAPGADGNTNRVLLASSRTTTASPADTNTNIIHEITIPAGILGANDSIEVIFEYSASGNAGQKTFEIRYGATSGTLGTLYLTTGGVAAANNSGRYFQKITCKNSTSSQEGTRIPAGFGTVNASMITSAIDTTAASYIQICIDKATAGDTVNINNFEVWQNIV